MDLFLFLVFAYLLGFPTGYILVRAKTGKDIRKDFSTGSSSSGSTNVSRVLGPKWGILSGVIDVAKAAICVWTALDLFKGWTVGLVGIAAVLGNLYPVLIPPPKLKGGKGVATTSGSIIPVLIVTSQYYQPWHAAILVGIVISWISLIFVFRKGKNRWMVIPSTFLSVGIVTFVTITREMTSLGYVLSVFLMCALVLWAHRENFRSLKRKRATG